jgi:hypothetical protein
MPARHQCHLLPVRPTNPYAPLGPSRRWISILGGFDGALDSPVPDPTDFSQRVDFRQGMGITPVLTG